MYVIMICFQFFMIKHWLIGNVYDVNDWINEQFSIVYVSLAHCLAFYRHSTNICLLNRWMDGWLAEKSTTFQFNIFFLILDRHGLHCQIIPVISGFLGEEIDKRKKGKENEKGKKMGGIFTQVLSSSISFSLFSIDAQSWIFLSKYTSMILPGKQTFWVCCIQDWWQMY